MQHDQQTSHTPAVVCGVDLPAQQHEGATFQFHANAPVFVPGIPWGLNLMDEFIQDLFALWDETAFAWEDEDRSCPVIVWFVDHSWPHPHCAAPRTVRLFADVHDWRRHLWQAWLDQILPGHELEFNIVSPMPATADATVAAHVVIIQRPNDFWVTSVVSCFDFSAAEPRLTQMAVTTHEHILLDNLARVMGFFEHCFGQEPIKLCTAAYWNVPLLPGAPLAGRSGYGIVVRLQLIVQVQTPLHPVIEVNENDDQSLLAGKAHVHAPGHVLSMSRPCHSPVVEPLSPEAVLIPLDCCADLMYSYSSDKIRQFKVTDNREPTSSGQSARIYPGLIPVPIPANAAPPAPLPPFVLDIFRNMPPIHVRANGEIAGLVIRVWYIHHRWHRLSRIARYLQLSGPPTSWQAQIVALWIDRLTPIEAIAINVVHPQPSRMAHEHSIAFDVIVSQGLHELRKATLFAVFPSHSDEILAHRTMAVSCRPRISGDWVLRALALAQGCQIHQCHIFHGWNEIPNTQVPAYDVNDGDGFAIHILRQILPMAPTDTQPAQSQPAEVEHEHEDVAPQGTVLLQLHALLHREVEPSQESYRPLPVRLEGLGNLREQLPTIIEVDPARTREAIQEELAAFGVVCDFELAANKTLAVCFPENWTMEPDQLLILFTDMHQDLPGSDSTFLTMIEHEDLSEVQLMSLLHQLGCEKGVILSTTQFRRNCLEIQYVQPASATPDASVSNRQQRPWPERTQKNYGNEMPLWNSKDPHQLPRCFLDLGVSMNDLETFFSCSSDQLCTLTEGLDLPEVTLSAVGGLKTHSKFDRLIIYTDGSSQSRHKHVAPALNEDLDLPDAWCFVVLGETFVNELESELTLVGWMTHQVRYDPEHPWYIGANQVGSAIAEREALTWAMIWRLGFNCRLPTVFRSDSLLTIGQANGSLGALSCDMSFQTLRGCFQALEAALGDDIDINHVFGHLGDPWNEMADTLAKAEARQSFFLARPNIDIPKLVTKLPFLWMIFDRSHGLPDFTGMGFDLRAPNLPHPTPPKKPDRDAVPQSKQVSMHLSIASANVLSLGATEQGFAGKLDYLRSQFCDLRLNLLGLQEARSDEGMSQKQGVLRLCSGSERGCWGVELWVNLLQPFAYVNKKGICFQKKDFHVAHRDARRLLVNINNAHFQAWCLVAHAPQSGTPMLDRQTWWQTTSDLLERHVGAGEQLFLCVDANAAPGVPDGVSVFQEGFRTSSSTPLLRELLDVFDLCLPITSALHEGSTTTWTSPDDGEFTIDYVAIPRRWFGACVLSKVLVEFDLANIHLDHTAVALELRWNQEIVIKPPSPCLHMGFDRSCINSSALRDLCSPADCHWQDDVEQQANQIANHFRTHLCRHFPLAEKGPKKPYISPEIWALRKQKISLRNQLRKGRSLLRRESLARTLLAWKSVLPGCSTDLTALDLSFAYGTSLRTSSFRCFVQFTKVMTALRTAIQGSRHQKLQEVLQQVTPATPASTIQKLLRPFKGPSNKLRQGMAPLPLVRDARGEFCKTADSALKRWIAFFGQMEGGQCATEQEQWTTWRSHLQQFMQEEVTIPVEEIPSLCELEVACRRTAAGKASGLDALPSEVCKTCPKAVALHLYSLLLKTCAHGQEALSHKGGILLPIWKGKNAKDQCSAFRSILLSSCFGKVMHKAVRTKQLTLYQNFLQAQQIGGRQGVPVTLGSHQVRAFQRLCSHLKQPSALLFIDLQEAFYRVVRPLVVAGPIDDELIATMAARIDLDEGFLHDLHQALQMPCALEDAGVPPHLRRTIRALHTDTFFKLPNQTDQVLTQIGTRPGDSFADVVFGYMMAKVLHKFQADMDALGLLLHIPDEEAFSPQTPNPGPRFPFVGPCWMDDLCICLTAANNRILEQALGTATGAILDTFKGFAMTPNLQPGKTAIVISPRGQGTNQWKKRLFGPLTDGSFFCMGEHHPYRVPLVTEYTHLGGKVHFSTLVKKEIKIRLGQAHQEFNKHRKLLYQNVHFAMDKKRELFQSLILSRLLYGAETWSIPDRQTREYLHGGIMGLYKRLLKWPFDKPISDEEVLYRTGMPSPSELLRVRRLRYLGSLMALGSTASWGLLNQDHEWQELIQDDFRWMWHQLQSCSDLGEPEAHMPRWIEVIRWHRGYWRRLVRRASEHAIGVQRREFLVSSAHTRFLSYLEDFEFILNRRTSAPACLGEGPKFGCMSCQVSCKTLGGEGAHMHRAHGEVHPVRTLMGSTQCGACLREYFTMGKLKAHLIRSTSCRTTLVGRGHREEVRPGLGSTEDTQRWLAWDNRVPPLPAEGPRLQDGHPRDFDTEHGALYEDIDHPRSA